MTKLLIGMVIVTYFARFNKSGKTTLFPVFFSLTRSLAPFGTSGSSQLSVAKIIGPSMIAFGIVSFVPKVAFKNIACDAICVCCAMPCKLPERRLKTIFLLHPQEVLADVPSTHGECRLRQMDRLVPQNLHGCRNLLRNTALRVESSEHL